MTGRHGPRRAPRGRRAGAPPALRDPRLIPAAGAADTEWSPPLAVVLYLLATYSLLVLGWGLAARGRRAGAGEGADPVQSEGTGEGDALDAGPVTVRVRRRPARSAGAIDDSIVASPES